MASVVKRRRKDGSASWFARYRDGSGKDGPIRYILAHEEFVYCHEVEEGERFHGMGEWAWAAGIAPLLGPWRLGAVQCV